MSSREACVRKEVSRYGIDARPCQALVTATKSVDNARCRARSAASDAFVASTLSQRADRAWDAAGLERITLHGCRHTFASLLIAAGENPKAVQEFMGHATITMTYDTYGHLFPGSREEARARMDAYLEAELAVGQPWANEPAFERPGTTGYAPRNRLIKQSFAWWKLEPRQFESR
jgi:Phage integrase family